MRQKNKSASNKFKSILNTMDIDEVYNFLWIYDQYVQELSNCKRFDEWDSYPVNIEEFYHEVYKTQLKGE